MISPEDLDLEVTDDVNRCVDLVVEHLPGGDKKAAPTPAHPAKADAQ
jgi:hypothetical protein